jgi:hypothetical protein
MFAGENYIYVTGRRDAGIIEALRAMGWRGLIKVDNSRWTPAERREMGEGFIHG